MPANEPGKASSFGARPRQFARAHRPLGNLADRPGQDPATASSIIPITVTDVAGFLSFLGNATLFPVLL